MPLNTEIASTLTELENIQRIINQRGNAQLKSETEEDLGLLIDFLKNHSFRELATVLFDGKIYDERETGIMVKLGVGRAEEAPLSPMLSPSPNSNSCASSSATVPNPPWTKAEVINLTNEGSKLGLVISGESTGIVVSIVAGDVADRNGRLAVVNHSMKISDVNTNGMHVEQVADVIRNYRKQVHLKVARPTSPVSELLNYKPDGPSDLLAPTRIVGYPQKLIGHPVQKETVSPNVDLNYDDLIGSDCKGSLKPEVEGGIKKKWSEILGLGKEIFVVQLKKSCGKQDLGMILEWVDMEVGSRYYIRSILAEGPAGQDGTLCSGDELLEVNGYRIHGMERIPAVTILRGLPASVRLVCARTIPEESNLIDPKLQEAGITEDRSIHGGSLPTTGYSLEPIHDL